ncbi:hypothetical protein N9R81_03895 [Flavobacteriales bacterium]|nr:hypothetical protein [Flavobacteriales bacterium]
MAKESASLESFLLVGFTEKELLSCVLFFFADFAKKASRCWAGLFFNCGLPNESLYLTDFDVLTFAVKLSR